MSPSPRALSARALELSLLFLMACSPYRELPVAETKGFAASGLERIFAERSKGAVYQADIELYGRYFTGLLVIKGQGPRTHRVVFMSEMGVKFFDLLFEKDRFELKHCIDKLDRNVVTSRIRKDLRLLLMPSIENGQEGEHLEHNRGEVWKFDAGEDGTFYYHLHDDQLEKGELVDGLGKKKKVIMRLSWDTRGDVLKRVVFEHKDIELKWSLKRVEG